MEVGEKFNVDEMKKSRVLHVEGMITYFQMHKTRFWCWGATQFTVFKDRGESVALRFFVTGLLFRGHIWVRCNGSDLMDVYFCSTRGTIQNKLENIFIEDLFDHMDKIIEIK